MNGGPEIKLLITVSRFVNCCFPESCFADGNIIPVAENGTHPDAEKDFQSGGSADRKNVSGNKLDTESVAIAVLQDLFRPGFLVDNMTAVVAKIDSGFVVRGKPFVLEEQVLVVKSNAIEAFLFTFFGFGPVNPME